MIRKICREYTVTTRTKIVSKAVFGCCKTFSGKYIFFGNANFRKRKMFSWCLVSNSVQSVIFTSSPKPHIYFLIFKIILFYLSFSFIKKKKKSWGLEFSTNIYLYYLMLTIFFCWPSAVLNALNFNNYIYQLINNLKNSSFF